MKQNNKGEITAFLSLVILLILAVVGTILESARVNVAKAYIDRALTTSMENILSEYYYPLYEDYHLFLLDGGYGTGAIDEERITAKMKENMRATFCPEAEIELLEQSVSIPNTDLFQIEVENIQMEDVTNITQYENKLFLHEIVAYMKYQMPTELIGTVTQGLSLSKNAAQSSEVIEKKLKLEASSSVLSEGMLDLIRQIEGIKVGKKGIEYDKNGLIKTEDAYVKKICANGINQGTVNISHNIVWNSLKNQYQNPIPLLDKIEEQLGIVESCYSEIREWKAELETLRGDKSEDMKEERAYIYEQMQKIGEQQQNAQDIAEQSQKQLRDLISGTRKKAEEALDTIGKIEQKKKILTEETREYEQAIEENKKDIPVPIYKSLETDLISQKDYLQGQQEKKEYNLGTQKLQSIKAVLNSNLKLLRMAEEVSDMRISGEEQITGKIKEAIASSKTALKNYNIKDLNFDYSSLKVNPEVKNPVDNFKKLMNYGILSLIVDDTALISKRKLVADVLQSDSLSEPDKEIDKSKEIADDIGACREGYQEEIADSFGNYAESEKAERGSSNEGILEKILFQEYLLTHFKNQNNTDTKEIDRNTVLKYEQEYLISGEKGDYDNFRNVISKLAFTRTILNYLYLITDAQKSQAAYAAAAAIIGFTCVEPLISLTKTIILLVWAYEEALVDVRGLIEQKYVPFFKTKGSFKIKFEELFLISKSLIKQKAEKLPKEEINLGDMKYKDYMRILLFLTGQKKKNLRAMDLIEQNMNALYEGEFKMNQCIFGYKVKGDFKIGAKFIKLPFICNILESNTDSYPYGIIKENSY